MTTEKRIAKITQKRDNGSHLGLAEAMEWDIYMKNDNEDRVGDFVTCYILHDEERDDFYLEEALENEKPTEEDWKRQERDYV